MKQLRIPTIVLGLVSCGITGVNAQLRNGLLDVTSVSSQTLATPTDWTVNAFRTLFGPFNDGASSEAFANVEAPGGQGLFFKPFQGTPSDALTVHFFQDNPGTPGLQYTLTGFAGTEANYSGFIPGSTTRSEFALEFLNAASVLIGGTVLDLETVGLGTPNGNPFNYAQYTVRATAPAGTASVRARASMIDGFNNSAGGGQAFVVDAFELTAVPEPTTGLFIGLSLFGFATIRRRS